jgi:hypothetical protein
VTSDDGELTPMTTTLVHDVVANPANLSIGAVRTQTLLHVRSNRRLVTRDGRNRYQTLAIFNKLGLPSFID